MLHIKNCVIRTDLIKHIMHKSKFIYVYFISDENYVQIEFDTQEDAQQAFADAIIQWKIQTTK